MVDQMLDEWGVSQLKDTFAENYIDAEALQFLSEEDIKQLIPQIGLRVKFMQNWKVHFQQKEVVNIPINLLQESSDVGSWISASFKQSDLNSSGSVSTQPDLFSDSASSTETLFPSSQMAPAKRQRKCLFDVKNILNNTVGGQNVIQHIRTHGFLSKKMRHNLVSILVSHLMETHGKNPSAYVKSALADSVITVFPQLKDPQGITGYEAFYTKGASKCPASGYLEEHLRYVRKQLIQKGLSTKASEKITAKSGAEADPDVEPLEMSDSTKDKIQWLKDNTEPATKVIDYMRDSLKYRREWINDKARTVREIIAEYPRLLDEGMIEEEYKMMYPDHADRLMDNWTSIKSSIIEFGIQHCSVWKEVLQLTCSDYATLSEDQQTNLSLFFLPLIFEGQRKAAGGRCSSSNASKREAFIDTQPDITNIPAYLKKIDSEKRPQPFILALHRDVSELQPTDIFVIVEKQALPQSSLLKAVDICYKLHFVLDCSYQDSCKGLWSFFQSFVFKQALKGRKESNTMRALRAFISYKTLAP
ncbi:uncharacterized protein [Asterias amurensis]|uniref:uncharacterized protein n=1 Tax=Asterias amurensis TaxID=7602 RepID=UPI003AB1D5BA